MAGIEFIGGEKGGVGKSVLARVMAQYSIDHGQRFIGFDTDRSHSTFLRFYGEFAARTEVDQAVSLDQIVEASLAEPERRVIVDLAAQTMPALSRWIDDAGVLEVLAEQGVAVRYWHVMDDGVDALALLDRLLDAYGTTMRIVVVLNHGRGGNFSAFHGSPTKTKAIERGVAMIELRALQEAAMHKIDQHGTSFWAAINRRGDEQTLGLLERQRVKVWLARAYSDLAPILGR
jgi:hypothetical protein